MNYYKTVISNFWDQFFAPLAWVLNFCSDKAQLEAKKASDTHKAFEMFNVAWYSVFLELMSLFLREKSNLIPESFENFVSHVSGHSNANVKNHWVFERHRATPIFVSFGCQKKQPAVCAAWNQAFPSDLLFLQIKKVPSNSVSSLDPPIAFTERSRRVGKDTVHL